MKLQELDLADKAEDKLEPKGKRECLPPQTLLDWSCLTEKGGYCRLLDKSFWNEWLRNDETERHFAIGCNHAAHVLPEALSLLSNHKARWPSGLRRCVQVRFELVTIRSLERGLGSNPSLVSFLFVPVCIERTDHSCKTTSCISMRCTALTFSVYFIAFLSSTGTHLLRFAHIRFNSLSRELPDFLLLVVISLWNSTPHSLPLWQSPSLIILTHFQLRKLQK